MPATSTDPAERRQPAGAPISTSSSRRTGRCSRAPAMPCSASRARPPPLAANLNVPAGPLGDDAATRALIRDHLRVIMLIRAYRVRGHLIAKLDPLRPDRHQRPSRARLPDLRLHRRRSRPRVLPRLRAGPREGDLAPDHGGAEAHLQLDRRHRVHAHPGTRSRSPGSRRGSRAPAACSTPRPRKSGRSSSSSPRPRASSSSCRSSSRAPSASASTVARAPSRRWRRSSAPQPSSACDEIVLGHAASWPAERARQRDGQALRRDSAASSRAGGSATRCWARAT